MKNARTDDRGSQRGQQRHGGSGAENLRTNGRLQDEISDRPHRPCHRSAKCPPLLRPRRERAGSKTTQARSTPTQQGAHLCRAAHRDSWPAQPASSRAARVQVRPGPAAATRESTAAIFVPYSKKHPLQNVCITAYSCRG